MSSQDAVRRALGHARRLTVALVSSLALLAVGTAAVHSQPSASELTKASALLDAERPEDAVALLNRVLKRHPKNASALLLRSTARFMLGDLAGGRLDLDRSLELDPENRQAWLNRAALELAGDNHQQALAAFRRAEALAPSAPDNSLNIGAVLLLLDRFDEARDRFKDYLARNPSDARARYLVATNYAMRGFAQPAIANLRRAIALDETMRREARSDPNFVPLAESAEFRELLNTDSYQHAPGSRIVTETYEVPYLAGQSSVLDAVIGSLQLAGRPFDPQVEVTPAWALVLSDVRIKVSAGADGGTVLELSAPPGRFEPGDWQAVSDQILRGVTVQLHTRTRR